jgi:diguanylate cyclase (GGDEF)-like protein
MSASAFRRSLRASDPLATSEELLRELLDEQAGLLQQVSQLRSSQPHKDHDDLTGLGTRRYFEARVLEELSRAARNPSYTGAMLLLDVDDLHALRARYGPIVGDRALRWVAKVLRESLRMGDVVCRGGGDRFMAVLCDTPAFDTGEIVSRVRGQITRVRGHRWSDAPISVGTAAWPDDAFTLPALTAIAAVRLLEDRQRREAQARPQLILLP